MAKKPKHYVAPLELQFFLEYHIGANILEINQNTQTPQ